MKFEWDEEKRKINLLKHGIDFVDVQQIFENEIYSVTDNRFDYGEVRYFTLGLLNGRVIAVAHTETDDIIRVISARKANKNDQEKYFKKIRN